MKKRAEELLHEVLAENPHLFLVDFKVDLSGKISVTIDGDSGVKVKDCVTVSRHIEHNLLEEDPEMEFSLDVFSAGVGSPLVLPRQFKNNVGRELKVITNQGEEFLGTLTGADETQIELSWSQKEPKEIGKGKILVEKSINIELSNIKQAIVQITF
ncbi:MAG: ribosome assembly cofactor RimP [Flavobacteriaceae bacterium]|nr:MAG: ribosome assembly cofactor RimP [Flavobacteriaceae bacterium]